MFQQDANPMAFWLFLKKQQFWNKKHFLKVLKQNGCLVFSSQMRMNFGMIGCNFSALIGCIFFCNFSKIFQDKNHIPQKASQKNYVEMRVSKFIHVDRFWFCEVFLPVYPSTPLPPSVPHIWADFELLSRVFYCCFPQIIENKDESEDCRQIKGKWICILFVAYTILIWFSNSRKNLMHLFPAIFHILLFHCSHHRDGRLIETAPIDQLTAINGGQFPNHERIAESGRFWGVCGLSKIYFWFSSLPPLFVSLLVLRDPFFLEYLFDRVVSWLCL